MKIQELITVAEEFYGNDKKANERYSTLWLLKTHAEIALENFDKIPEVAQYQLTEVEFSAIIMLQGFASHLIQEAAFNPNMSNALSSILIDALDSALIKIPKNTEEILPRPTGFTLHKMNKSWRSSGGIFNPTFSYYKDL